MVKTWREIGFQRHLTGDGSLTLRSLGAQAEFMHHSGGALEETLFIYGEPLRELFQSLARPSVFSLGLGLGYVEAVTAAHALRARKPFEMLTMEIDPHLVSTFKAYLAEALPPGEVKEDLDSVFRGIAFRVDVSARDLQALLQESLEAGRWRVLGAFGADSLPERRFHGLMYDAFSSKTNPELWTEEFLKRFLDQCAEPDALLATYAYTGNLKRALRAAGFSMDDKTGFQGKRNATLGRRGLFTSRRDS